MYRIVGKQTHYSASGFEQYAISPRRNTPLTGAVVCVLSLVKLVAAACKLIVSKYRAVAAENRLTSDRNAEALQQILEMFVPSCVLESTDHTCKEPEKHRNHSVFDK
eukprot:gb/GECG01015379.1/.p1 GENE.gb/GECG01015379.1/~~gb/GECG01015379.1/.p1  ORF type:complete len:107 (+),score=6.98 gb/GECG01015379.1/:1-321(+)